MTEQEEIRIGDAVVDLLTHQRLEVIDIFTRDGVRLYEMTNNHGSTTTVTRNWITKSNQ